MVVRIKFLGILKKHQPTANAAGYWEVEARGQTIDAVLAGTSLAASQIGYVVLVNGLRKPRTYVLQDGEELMVMPLIAGG